MPCPHEDFVANVDVARITANDDDPTIIGYKAEITVVCATCFEQFHWMGNLPVGDLPNAVTTNVDGSVLSAPLRPRSADPMFGLGLLGYTMRTTMASPEGNN